MSLKAAIKDKLEEVFTPKIVKETSEGFKINTQMLTNKHVACLSEVQDWAKVNVEIKRSGTGLVILIC